MLYIHLPEREREKVEERERKRERKTRENKTHSGPLDKDLASWNIQKYREAKCLC